MLKIELTKLLSRQKSFNVENCKRFNTRNNCRIKTENFQTSINKLALIQQLKIYRYKKVILRNFKAELRRKLMLLRKTFRKLTSLEIPKLWQMLKFFLPEQKLIEVLYLNTSESLQSIKKTISNGLLGSRMLSLSIKFLKTMYRKSLNILNLLRGLKNGLLKTNGLELTGS